MSTVTIQEAQARLPDLIKLLYPGEEIVIVDNDLPVARLVGSQGQGKPRKPGACAGMLTIISEDEEHLEGFAEYMP